MYEHDSPSSDPGEVRRHRGQAEGGGDGGVHGVAAGGHDAVADLSAVRVVGRGRVGGVRRGGDTCRGEVEDEKNCRLVHTTHRFPKRSKS